MTNPFVLWLTGVLGWSEPGFVVMLLTLLALIALWFLIRFLVIDLPFWLADQRRNSRGPARFLVTLLLIVAVVVAFFVNFIVTAVAILALVGLAGSFRDWWQKGGK